MPQTVITVAIALLSALLLSAVVTDLCARRIPNAHVLGGIALATIMHLIAMATGAVALAGPNWWSPLAGLATGFFLLLPLHLLRATGAGDVKLMAAVGAFVGPESALAAALYTLLAGGLLSLVYMLGRGVAGKTLANVRFMLTDWAVRTTTGQGTRLAPLQTTAARLPYAVAIALGTAAALVWPLGRLIPGAGA